MSEKKSLGKFHDIWILIIGFILTGVIGSYLNESIQRKAWEREQKAVLLTKKTDRATELFQFVSELMSKRLVATRQLLYGFRDNLDQDTNNDKNIEERLYNYRTIIEEWNTKRGFYREMLKFYYGDIIYNSERDIHYMLRAIGQGIECEINQTNSVDLKYLFEKSKEVSQMIGLFNAKVSIALESDRIGSLKDTTSIVKSDRINFNCSKNVIE